MDQKTETRIQEWQWPEDEVSEAPPTAEPRYHLYPPVKVTRLDDPEEELDCVLTNISLTDIKILAGESLPENEIVVIELQDSLLLADVRYSLPRKNKFAIGAARMHTLQKLAVPQHAAKIEMLELLVSDFHAQCASQIESLQSTIHSLQTQSRKETGGRESTAFELKMPEIPGALNEIPSLTAEPRIARAADSGDGVLFRPAQIPQEKSRAKEETATSSGPGPAESGASGLAEGKTSQENSLSPGRNPRMKFAALAGLLAVIGAAALFAWWTDGAYSTRASSSLHTFQQSSSQPPAKPVSTVAESKPLESRIPETAPLITPPIPAPPSAPVEALETPSPAAASVSSNLRHVSITTTEKSWIDVCSDGKEVVQKLLPPGATREFDFAKKATLRLGNPRSVEITVDGTLVEPPGRKGAVSGLELSPDGSRFLLAKEGILSGCGTRQPVRNVALNRQARPEPPRPFEPPSPQPPAVQPELPAPVELSVEPAQ